MTKVKKETKVIKTPKQKVIKKKPLKNKSIEKKKLKIIETIKTDTEKENVVKVEKVEKNTSVNYDDLNIDLNQLQRGVEALLQYTEKHKSKDLFKGQQQIFVQISCVRIPSGINKKYRLKLKHPLMTMENEICFIVPDLKRGRKVDHEETVEYYENLLREKNVTFIKRILPVRQLRVEYDQFELKRRLCGYYDYFLVDGRVSGHVAHILGKTFTEKRKTPIPVHVTSKNLGEAISKAMSKTELHIHTHGDSYIVHIGSTDMPAEHIVDNLKVIIDALAINFPGSWKNVRSLHVKSTKSIAIPVYYSLRDVNEVQPPKIKRTKLGEPITDELSTTNHTVTVFPDGKVVLNDPRAKNQKAKAKLLKKTKTKGTPQKTKKKKAVKKSEVNGKSPNSKLKKVVKVKQEPKKVVKVKKDTVSSKKVQIEKQH